ncbi:MAG TPA: hypothetical protein PKY30_19330, partial [Myxococcota bacterium]|nr:hypothetical protein [Myxococcota bacterium]
MLLLVLLLDAAVAGTTPPPSGQEAAELLEERRAAAETKPVQTAALLAWGDALLDALAAGQKLSPGRDVKPCLKALERGAVSSPDAAAALLSKAAEILAKTGADQAALEHAWGAVEAELNPQSLSLLLSLQEKVDPAEIGGTCSIVRTLVQDDGQRLLLLQS